MQCGECIDRMVHAWEYIGSQRGDYQLCYIDKGK